MIGEAHEAERDGVSLPSEHAKPWKLVPLTPEYLESEHAGYVSAIEAALDNEQIHNIALSGNYGVGKSSILREVARRLDGRVVELSLSTLAPLEATSLEDSLPKQATTPTNRIQQEIVKQLLYREEPGKTPGSRFRRIERFIWAREAAVACLVGFVVAVVFLLCGWAGRIRETFMPLIDLGLWTHLIVFLVAAGVSVVLRRLLYWRLHVKQFSAGPAAITLDEKSVSYFDQYLDEIVYFFEVSRRDVVIFEDLDRFNDSHIFETLRSLNTLLNASPQIVKPIRFIYAIKDSIFDRIGLEYEGRKLERELEGIDDPAQAEAVRANRTKFFNLVIPVVPFITHRSARNLAVKLLAEIEQDVSPDLLDLAGKYVPDMRLLKNVRNEFIVFRDRIFSGEGRGLDLSETDLFAMMLYKSTHLTDFEAIRIGRSKLDELYEIHRKLVGGNITRIEREVRATRQRLDRINGAEGRGARLGDRLIAHVARTVRAAGYGGARGAAFIFAGVARSEDDLKSLEFWNEFVTAPDGHTLDWRDVHGRSLTFTRADLAAALGDSLSPDDWRKADRDSLNEALHAFQENLEFLRGADMGAVIRRPEFLVDYGGTEQSLDMIAGDLLTRGLAYQLVRAGYINRNFTLYTSTFHGDRVSPAATNFIIHHVERDVMDEHFELEPEDVEAVVRECGSNALAEPALYNIAILDHLLRTDVSAADIMIRSLTRLGDDQARFLQAYLSSGSERTGLVENFTAVSSQVLVYLVNQVELDEATRLDLVSVALANLADEVHYRVDATASSYFTAHYAELVALTSAPIDEAQAERIAALFAEAGIQVPALEPLSRTVREALVSHDLYAIERSNLQIALDSEASLALDVAREANHNVYAYMLRNLSTYLSAIDGVSATVDAREFFKPVIEDVLKEDAARLSEVIEGASTRSVVTKLADVSEGAWTTLAEHERFPATFNNISSYISSVGALDHNVAKVLESGRAITEHDAAGEDEKAQLAKTILAARDQLPSAALRVELVASLDLRNCLPVVDVTAENGELFALLVKRNIIADDAATYAHLGSADWESRELIVTESTHFMEYVTPALVHGDLTPLLLSDRVDRRIKEMLVDQAEMYFAASGSEDLTRLAMFATQQGRGLTLDMVVKMASQSVPSQYVVILLEPHLDVLGREQLFTILHSLGGEYAGLTSVGRDQPKIPNTRCDRALLERLKREGTVNSYDESASPIKVYKRHK